jgi:pyruvate/2-oxoglutarate dehydrogenase complex dihydrolipoamide acyltransferase (E2) component
MRESKIVVPSEIPLDETVMITRIHFESGRKIEKGAEIFEIETSKTAYVLVADEKGILEHRLEIGDEVKSGETLGIVKSEDSL